MLDLIVVFLILFGFMVGMTYLHYVLYFYMHGLKALGLYPWRMAWKSLQFKSPVEWDRIKVPDAEGNR